MSYHFELLTYYWQEGFRDFVFDSTDDGDSVVWFDDVEGAVEEIQGCFDIWNKQLRDGERESGFDAEEFVIRCIETKEFCGMTLSDGKVFLRTTGVTERLIPEVEYERINRTGTF